MSMENSQSRLPRCFERIGSQAQSGQHGEHDPQQSAIQPAELLDTDIGEITVFLRDGAYQLAF